MTAAAATDWEREVAEHQLTKALLDQALLELRHARAKLDDLRSEPYSALAVNSSLQTAIAELNLELSSSNLKNQKLQLALEESERERTHALHNSRISEEVRQDSENKLEVYLQERTADKLRILELDTALESSRRELEGANAARDDLLKRCKTLESAKDVLASSGGEMAQELESSHLCARCGSLLTDSPSHLGAFEELQGERAILINSKKFLEESRDNLVKQLQSERDSHLNTAEEKAALELRIRAMKVENTDLQQRVQSYMQLSEDRQRIILGHCELLQQFMIKHVSNADEAMVNLQSRMSEIFAVFIDLLSAFHLVTIEMSGESDATHPCSVGSSLGVYLEGVETQLRSIHDSCKGYLLTRFGDKALDELEIALSEPPTQSLSRSLSGNLSPTIRSNSTPFLLLPEASSILERIRLTLGFPSLRKAGPAIRTQSSHSLDLVRTGSIENTFGSELFRPKLRELIWALLFQGRENNVTSNLSDNSAEEADRLAKASVSSAVRILADKKKEKMELLAEFESLGAEFLSKARPEKGAESEQRLGEPKLKEETLLGDALLSETNGGLNVREKSEDLSEIPAVAGDSLRWRAKELQASPQLLHHVQCTENIAESSNVEGPSVGMEYFDKSPQGLSLTAQDNFKERIKLLELALEKERERVPDLLNELKVQSEQLSQIDYERQYEEIINKLNQDKDDLALKAAQAETRLETTIRLLQESSAAAEILQKVNEELLLNINSLKSEAAHVAEEVAAKETRREEEIQALHLRERELEDKLQRSLAESRLHASNQMLVERNLNEHLEKTRILLSSAQPSQDLLSQLQEVEVRKLELEKDIVLKIEDSRIAIEKRVELEEKLEEMLEKLKHIQMLNDSLTSENEHLLLRKLELERILAQKAPDLEGFKSGGRNMTVKDSQKFSSDVEVNTDRYVAIDEESKTIKDIQLIGVPDNSVKDFRLEPSIVLRASREVETDLRMNDIVDGITYEKLERSLNEERDASKFAVRSLQDMLREKGLEVSKALLEVQNGKALKSKLQDHFAKVLEDIEQDSVALLEDIKILLQEFEITITEPCPEKFKSAVFKKPVIQSLLQQLHFTQLDYRQSLSFLVEAIATSQTLNKRVKDGSPMPLSVSIGILMKSIPNILQDLSESKKLPQPVKNVSNEAIVEANRKNQLRILEEVLSEKKSSEAELEKAIGLLKISRDEKNVLAGQLSIIKIELEEERTQRLFVEERRLQDQNVLAVAEAERVALESKLKELEELHELSITDKAMLSTEISALRLEADHERRLKMSLEELNSELQGSVDNLILQLEAARLASVDKFTERAEGAQNAISFEPGPNELEAPLKEANDSLLTTRRALHEECVKVNQLRSDLLNVKHGYEVKILETEAKCKSSEELAANLRKKLEIVEKELGTKQQLASTVSHERDSLREEIRDLKSKGRSDVDRLRSENNSKMIEMKKLTLELDQKLKAVVHERDTEFSRMKRRNDALSRELEIRQQAWSKNEKVMRNEIELLQLQRRSLVSPDPSTLAQSLDSPTLRGRKAGGVNMARSKSLTDISYLSRLAAADGSTNSPGVFKRQRAFSTVSISMATQTEAPPNMKAQEQLMSMLVTESSHLKASVVLLKNELKMKNERLDELGESEAHNLNEISRLNLVLQNETEKRDELLSYIFKLQKDMIDIESRQDSTEISIVSKYMHGLRTMLDKVKLLANTNDSLVSSLETKLHRSIQDCEAESELSSLRQIIKRQEREMSTLKELKDNWEKSCNQMCHVLEEEREQLQETKRALKKAIEDLTKEQSNSEMKSMELKTSLMSMSVSSKTKVTKLEQINSTNKDGLDEARATILDLESKLEELRTKVAESDNTLALWKARAKSMEAQTAETQNLLKERQKEWEDQRHSIESSLMEAQIKLNQELSKNIELTMKVKSDEEKLNATVLKQDMKVKELVSTVQNAGDVERLLRQEIQRLEEQLSNVTNSWRRKEELYEDKLKLTESKKSNHEILPSSQIDAVLGGRDSRLQNAEVHENQVAKATSTSPDEILRNSELLTALALKEKVLESVQKQLEKVSVELRDAMEASRRESSRAQVYATEVDRLFAYASELERLQAMQSHKSLLQTVSPGTKSDAVLDRVKSDGALASDIQSELCSLREELKNLDSEKSTWKMTMLQNQSLEAKVNLLQNALLHLESLPKHVMSSVGVQCDFDVLSGHAIQEAYHNLQKEHSDLLKQLEDTARSLGNTTSDLKSQLREKERILCGYEDEFLNQAKKHSMELESERSSKERLLSQLTASQDMIRDLLERRAQDELTISKYIEAQEDFERKISEAHSIKANLGDDPPNSNVKVMALLKEAAGFRNEIDRLNAEKSATEIQLSEVNQNFIGLCRDFERERENLKKEIESLQCKGEAEKVRSEGFKASLDLTRRELEKQSLEKSELVERLAYEKFISQKAADDKASQLAHSTRKNLLEQYLTRENEMLEHIQKLQAQIQTLQEGWQAEKRDMSAVVEEERRRWSRERESLKSHLEYERRQQSLLRKNVDQLSHSYESMQAKLQNNRTEETHRELIAQCEELREANGRLEAQIDARNSAAILAMKAERDSALSHLDALRSSLDKVLSSSSIEKSRLESELRQLKSPLSPYPPFDVLKLDSPKEHKAVQTEETFDSLDVASSERSDAIESSFAVRDKSSDELQLYESIIEHESTTETILYLRPDTAQSDRIDENRITEELLMMRELAEQSRRRNHDFLQHYDMSRNNSGLKDFDLIDVEVGEEIRMMQMATRNLIVETASQLDQVYRRSSDGDSHRAFEGSLDPLLSERRYHSQASTLHYDTSILSRSPSKLSFPVNMLQGPAFMERQGSKGYPREIGVQITELEEDELANELAEDRNSLSSRQLQDIRAATIVSLSKTAEILRTTEPSEPGHAAESNSSDSIGEEFLPRAISCIKSDHREWYSDANDKSLGDLKDLDLKEIKAATATSLERTASMIRASTNGTRTLTHPFDNGVPETYHSVDYTHKHSHWGRRPSFENSESGNAHPIRSSLPACLPTASRSFLDDNQGGAHAFDADEEDDPELAEIKAATAASLARTAEILWGYQQDGTSQKK
ncbi:hypothetical protein HDU67_003367 [Dinochytrium kinnereticum]|nr:hypothetical protein HDU67_003367 [Dinochytrium kinnereticum]